MPDWSDRVELTRPLFTCNLECDDSASYQRKSIPITAQRLVAKQHDLNGMPIIADAILDRIIRKSHGAPLKAKARKRKLCASVTSVENTVRASRPTRQRLTDLWA
jgi:hypothetical protein